MPLITESVGRVLGKRYRLLSAVGAGASAQVFLAEDVSLRRHVAVKVLQPGLADDEAFLKRFRAEARLVASLNHPHLLRVFDWGEESGEPYLVLEYLGGGSLLDLYERGTRLSPSQASLLGAHIARGLAYAHSRGLVHRDIKPANLLFDDEGRVRVADFGVARALAEAAWTEPAGSLVGTARYASPEQAQGSTLDGRADVYSLALVLYEGLTGEVPFVADTTVGTLMARVGRPLPQHTDLGPLQEILTWAASPQPADRPQAADLATRFEAAVRALPAPQPLLLASHGKGAGPETVVGRVAGPALAAMPAPASHGVGNGTVAPGRAAAARNEVFDIEALARANASTEEPSHRTRWIVALVVLIAALGGGAYAAVKNQVFIPNKTVPALSGLTVVAARQAAAPGRFSLSANIAYSTTVPAGHIISQRPSAQSVAKAGSALTVVLSKGPPPEAVPSLLLLNCNAAIRILQEVHLKGSCPPETAAYSNSIPLGQIINWSYANKADAGRAPYGSTIQIVVSKGPAPVPIPSVFEDTFTQAQSTLVGAGLTVTQANENSTSVPAGEVTRTVPAAGSPVAKGSAVTVYVSQGPPLVSVPPLGGDSVAVATAALQKVGLSVGPVYGPPNGSVFDTVPTAGTAEPVGTAITLYTD
jgi:beta-lactam-binding protein with PASTA domain/tRNA A-37 threonylcarbamoyl transferase component Bud32